MTVSPAQRRVLDAIHALLAERGYSPSHTEIAERAGLSARSTVLYHLLRLERAGLVTLPARGQARGVTLTPLGMSAASRAVADPSEHRARTLLAAAVGVLVDAPDHEDGSSR